MYNNNLDDLPGEIWKDIENYENYYLISNLSRVKSLARIVPSIDGGNITIHEKIMKPNLNTRGYLYIGLRKDGKSKCFLIHRLMAIAFIPNPHNHPQVHHKNDIKTDNNLDNFKWGKQKENTADAIKNGRINYDRFIGERHPNAKLTEIEVLEIRKMWKTNNFSQKEIGKKFNITCLHVGELVRNRSWKHLISK